MAPRATRLQLTASLLLACACALLQAWRAQALPEFRALIPNGEQRAQPFATGGDDMRGDLWDQRHFAVHLRDDRAVTGVEVLLDQANQRSERILAIDRLRNGGRHAAAVIAGRGGRWG